MTQIKSTIITNDNIELEVSYVYESMRLQILSVNKIPQYHFGEDYIDELHSELSTTLIQEAIDKKEYADEMRADEERGN